MAEQSSVAQVKPALAIDALVERRRELSWAEILVKEGDRLEPNDIVARCAVQDQIVALDLAGSLGLEPAEVPDRVLVRAWDQVEPGTLVAERHHGRKRARQVLAGVRGVVIGVEDGTLFIRGSSEWAQLRAYVPGVVTQLIPGRGVVMQTTGHVVRGVWGTGGEENGILSLQVDEPSATLPWNQVGREHDGMILVAGTLQSSLALERASRHHVAGIIVGSLHPALREACQQAPFPIVITEGMGQIPMAAPIFELLQKHDGNRVVIAGDSRRSASGPEIIIPVPVDDATPAATEPTAPVVGAIVRLTCLSRLGAIGEVVSIPEEPQVGSTGERVRGAWVRLTDRKLVFVPLESLEILVASSPDPLALLH